MSTIPTPDDIALAEDISGCVNSDFGNAWLEIEQAANLIAIHCATLREDLSQAQRWIRRSPGRRPDHACAACFPSGELVQPGFICAECKAHEVKLITP